MSDSPLNGKVLLVTGGTGSFGNAVVQRFLQTGVAEIRVFSRDEKKQEDMRYRYSDDKLKFYVGDVRNYESIADAMRGVDLVFSAAALKQVPSCEFYPLEAVRTNIHGSANTMEAAIAHRVKTVVMLSTDKAVYPINAMGMSKAMMEKLVVAKSRNVPRERTTLCVTRYGNVMASRGSVIPFFMRQIKSGGDVTVTDPNMTRFMMSLENAVELVIFALEHAQPGDTFIQKAPAATIGDLASVLIELCGGSNRIRTIGLRHGEKTHESLTTKEESVRAVDLGGYLRIPADSRNLDYGRLFDAGDLRIADAEPYTSANTKRLTRDDLKLLLQQINLEEA
jgi:UDP-N-acetylglucosamine 4,6-dehydratase